MSGGGGHGDSHGASHGGGSSAKLGSIPAAGCLIGLLVFMTGCPMIIKFMTASRGSSDYQRKAHSSGQEESRLRDSRDEAVCADAKNLQFAPESGVFKVEVAIQPECWSGWVTTPADWREYFFQSAENKGAWIQFREGESYYLPQDSSPWFQNERGIFRFKGPKGKMLVTIQRGRG